MLDWNLPGGQDHYFKAVSELAAEGGFTGEKAMEISKRFDTNSLRLIEQHGRAALQMQLIGHWPGRDLARPGPARKNS